MGRPWTFLGSTTGILAGAAMAPLRPDAVRVEAILGAVVAFAALTLGSNVLNQLTDIEIDRVNTPSRPLPRAAVPRRWAWGVVLLAWSFGGWIAYAVDCAGFYSVGVLLAVAYSSPPIRWKRHWASAALTIGLGRGLLLPLAGASAGWESSNEPFPWGVAAWLAVLVAGTSWCKDFRDVAGDRSYGIKTLPVALGRDAAARWLFLGLVVPALVIPVLIALGWLPWAAAPLTLLAPLGWLLHRGAFPGERVSGAARWRADYLVIGAAHLMIIMSSPLVR